MMGTVVQPLIPSKNNNVPTENRDPSPASYDDEDELDVNQQPTYSTESEEPWDQRPATSTESGGGLDSNDDYNNSESSIDAMRMSNSDGYGSTEEELEDGELPSLTTARNSKLHNQRIGGRVVNGQVTTTRPLSPPSQAGMNDQMRKNRNFWGQFDGDSDERGGDGSGGCYSPGVPDDESPTPRGGGRRGANRRGGGGTDDYDNQSGASDSRTGTHFTAESYDEQPEDTFCGQALDAIGDICGVGLGITDGGVTPGKIKAAEPDPNANRKKKVTNTSRNSRGQQRPVSPSPLSPVPNTTSTEDDDDDDGEEGSQMVQEHTAIEVEFVEPKKPAPELTTPSITPERKNAFLTAMAMKAKQDFEEKRDHYDQVEQASAVSVKTSSSSAVVATAAAAAAAAAVAAKPELDRSSPADADSDVYSSFSASDKRKFLKLINSGQNPSAAAEQVAQDKGERNRQDNNKVADNDSSHNNNINNGPNNKQPSRGSRLAFWKKNQSPKVEPPVDKKEKLQSVHPPESVQSPPVQIMSSTPGDEEILEEMAEKLVENQLSKEETMRIIKPRTDKLEEGVPPVEESPIPIPEQRGGAVQQKQINEADITHPETDSSGELAAAAAAEPFAKSGINYYDAVRLDDSDDDISDHDFPAASSKGALRSGPRLGTNLVSRGFAMLDARSVPRVPVPETDSAGPTVRPPLSPPPRDVGTVGGGGGGGGDVEFSTARTPAVAEVANPGYPPEELNEVPPEEPAQIETTNEDDKEKEVTQRRTVQSLSENKSVNSSMTEDADSIGQIEKTLLRPVPKDEEAPAPTIAKPNTPVARDNEVNTKENVHVEGRNIERFEPRSEPSSYTTPPTHEHKKKTSVYVDAMEEMSMDEYLNSTERYPATAGTSMAYDNASIYTSGTGLSNYSQSSRVRRPGAAKGRLAQAKRANETRASKNGWHESIRAVAASTNRVWDPEYGWIDYKDRDESTDVADTSNEMIHLNLEKSIRPLSPRSEGMMASETTGDAVKTNIVSASNSQPRNKAWLESMKAASASIEEHTWDPETGWQKDVDSHSPNDSIDASRGPVDTEDMESNGLPTQLPAKKTNDVRSSDGVDQPDNQQAHIPRPPASRDKKLTKWIAKVEQGPRAERSTESSDKAVVLDEKYMQIGDHGSVRSFVKADHSSPNQKKGGEGISGIGIVEDSEPFPSFGVEHERPNPESSVTNVVKEKVGEAEFNLFHHEEAKGGNRKQPGLGNVSLASSSPGRSSCPVDVDEVEVTDDEVGEDNHDPQSEVSSGFLGSSPGSPYSKSVPKLRRSKRDTSPIRDRNSSIVDVIDSPPITASQAHSEPQPAPAVPVTPVTPERHYLSPSTGRPASPPFPVDAAEVGRGSGSGVSETNSSNVSSVKERLQQWEERASKSPRGSFENPEATPITPEWKAFLGKKVMAESMAAAKQQDQSLQQVKDPEEKVTTSSSNKKFVSPRELVSSTQPEDDSLFQFPGPSPQRSTNMDGSADLSAIEPSEPGSAYGPDPSEPRSFFKRLSECAAPVMASSVQCTVPLLSPITRQKPTEGGSMPTAHLAFLRQSPQATGSKPVHSNNLSPPAFCGRPDDVQEEVTSIGEEHFNEGVKGDTNKQSGKGISLSTDKARSRSRGRGSTGSVVSDDGFGAKTAYLESIAMKTAVSKPKKGSRSRSSGSSVVSSSSTQHSEKWKAFLERKKGSTASPPGRSNSTADVSKAAEKYAAEKVEEMMSVMAARSRSAPDGSSFSQSRLNGSTNKEQDKNAVEWKQKKAESVRAAEDLASARVEAMMAALSSSHDVDEGEI